MFFENGEYLRRMLEPMKDQVRKFIERMLMIMFELLASKWCAISETCRYST